MPRGVYDRKPKPKTEDTVTDPTIETAETVETVGQESTEGAQPDLRTDMEREADEQAAKARAELETQGELCGQCWPEGWQGDQDAAECSHGAWTR